MNKFDLTGRKALVTGGARGLGEGMAQALAAAGASVMIGDVLTSLGRDVAGKLASGGAKAGFVQLDVTREEDWQAAVTATVETLGGFDILINNAGASRSTALVSRHRPGRTAPNARCQRRRHRARA